MCPQPIFYVHVYTVKLHRPGFLISDTIDIREPGILCCGWGSVLCSGGDLATSVASIY